MTKKIWLIIFVIFNILALTYLLWPLPQIPDLPRSLKSTEEGDTVQMKNVNGYFTDQNRAQVMSFYYQIYHHPLIIKLNHPPEKSKQIFRDTIQSYYLEELVIPFKQSLFINGFEWENDVFTKPEKRITNKILVGEKVFKAKITTRTYTASTPATFISFLITEFSIFLIIFSFKKSFSKHP